MRQKWNKNVKIQGELVENILKYEDDADDDGSNEEEDLLSDIGKMNERRSLVQSSVQCED